MKIKSLFLSVLCALCVTSGFISCSDDDEDLSWKEGAKVDLPSYRAFILSEGLMNQNNSHLFYVDPTTDKPYSSDIFEAQNGIKLGDTANDMIVEDGNIFILVNVSKIIFRLNGSGVVQDSYKNFDSDNLGEPRYMVEKDGKLYVTCYGGYVARFDAKSLTYEAKVQTDPNPEEIIEYNGILYCVCSGMGTGNTLCIIDSRTFENAESVVTLDNPSGIKEANGHIYITAYGFYDINWNNDPKVGIFNPQTKQTTEIAKATRVLATGDELYIANSTSPDWTNYTTTLSVYNAKTGNVRTWNLSGEGASDIATGNIYMMEQNPYDKSFYIATTDYATNSPVYHFTSDGQYISTFNAGGINANNMVFVKN